MQFVDTNIFIRYFTRDDPAKAEACRQLFERARDNQIDLTTSEAVIAEVVFVLSARRLYNLSPQDVRARLLPILALPGLKLPHKSQLRRALDLYGTHAMDFEDALSMAIMERRGIGEIYSYDRDFDRIQGSSVVRIEP